MKYVLLLQFFVLSIAFGQNNSADSIYYKPEVPAKFKYGEEELNNFISSNLILNPEARYYGVNGEVSLTIIIDTLGKIINIKADKEQIDFGVILDPFYIKKEEDLKGLFGDEAKRVALLLSGLYEPATNQGTYVISSQTLTFTFSTLQYKKNQRDYHKQIRNETIKWTFGEYMVYDQAYDTIRYNNGVLKMSENKIDLACRYFEEAIRINPKYIDAYYNLGIAYKNLRRNTDACISWKKAEELGDKEAQTLIKKYCF